MIVIIAGHYGVGKTNLSLNLALDFAREGWKATVADVDIVNPYFRSSDYREVLEREGVEVIAPLFAGSSLDNPSLSPRISTAIEWAGDDSAAAAAEGRRVLIMDIGGDDVGATSIARFSEKIAAYPYRFLYVVNRNRNLTQCPAEALEVLREIELKSRLHATAIVNNSHMRDETSVETVRESEAFGAECARIAGIPLLATTVPYGVADAFSARTASLLHALAENATSGQLERKNAQENYYPVRKLVLTPWE